MPEIRKRICVLASDITSNTVSLTIKGIMKTAYAYNYDVCVFATLIRDSGKADYQYGEKNIFKLPNFERFDGVIVLAGSIKIANAVDEIEERLRKTCTCPVIIVDRESKYYKSIRMDDEKTMESLVDHLIDVHGHKKIDCLTGTVDDYCANQRLNGYKRSLNSHGISVDSNHYIYSESLLDSAVEYAYNVANGILPKPDAVVCCDDYVAVMMAKEFMIQGIKVPQDIAIVGYDSSYAGTSFIPCITSAVPPCKELGANAMTLLYNEITGENVPLDLTSIGKLTIGQSCGCDNDLHYEERKREQEATEGCFTERYFNSTFMEENLTSAATIDDCMQEINWYTYQLNKFKEFYICLIDDWDSYKHIRQHVNWNEKLSGLDKDAYRVGEYVKDGYTDHMVMHAKNKDGEVKVVRESFLTSDILPALYENREYPTTYFFTPIHFKDRCLGYIAINFGSEVVTYDPYYHTWVRNINNAIEIIRNQSELRYINDKLNQMALYDELTSVYNRFGFDQEAKKMIVNSIQKSEKLLLLVGDLDNLKVINDGFGHLEGDIAISTVAKAFDYAANGNGCLGRLGGDEFIMLLSGDYDEEAIRLVKNNIDLYLKEFNEKSGKQYDIHVSVGHYCESVAGFEDRPDEIFDYFVNNADKEMYRVKRNKKLSNCAR